MINYFVYKMFPQPGHVLKFCKDKINAINYREKQRIFTFEKLELGIVEKTKKQQLIGY